MKIGTRDFWCTKEYRTGMIQMDEDADLHVTCIGLAIYKDSNNSYQRDILEIAHLAVDHKLDFNHLLGFYKMVVFQKDRGTYLFWGDNQGSQCFFLDEVSGLFSDSFLSLIDSRKEPIEPCYESIAQLLSGGYLLSDEMVVKRIFVTSMFRVYCFDRGVISSESKQLLSFEENSGASLQDVMTALCAGLNHCSSAVCTGGTDSRTVLAHMVKKGMTPKLVLTARKDNPDVAVSQKIADVTGLDLTIIDPSKKSENWIETGFAFSDGMYDPVLAYRQLSKAEWNVDNGLLYEFGGVGGEFYKNDFCKYFLWRLFLFGTSKLHTHLLSSLSKEIEWMGDGVLSALHHVRLQTVTLAQKYQNEELLCACNSVGYEVLTKKSQPITNMYASHALKIDPLMDRNVVAHASKCHPLKHSMAVWQRKEIKACAPELCEIPTDQGYSCSMRFDRLQLERVKKVRFYISRIIARVRRRLNKPHSDGYAHYWDLDYNQGLETALFDRAFLTCKNLHIIRDDCDKKSLPIKNVGNIILLGMIFDADKYKL